MPVENKPVSFGYKTAWLVLRTEDTDRVVEALDLADRRLTDWQTGIDAAYAGEDVYVSPPVKGWVFAVGMPLYGAGVDATRSMAPLKELLRELSAKFEEVQAFASHRVTEYHHWAVARNGNVSRSFAYSGERGEVLDDEGTKTGNEPSLHLELDDEFNGPNEDSVMEVAGAWGINPLTLEDEPFSNRLGVLGSIKIIGSARQQSAKKKGFRLPWFR